MSLINDALRRAKQVQEQAPAPPPPAPLNPVEHTPLGPHGVGLIVPVAITVVALMGLFLVWQLYQRNNSNTSAIVNASPSRQTGASVESEPISNAVQPSKSAPSATPNANVATAVPSGPGTAKAAATPGPNALPSPGPSSDGTAGMAVNTNAVATTPDSLGTNAAVAAQPEPPKPAPLTLQGIVFNPRRPSVVINGRTLFVGERIGQFRVAAINPDSATLIGGGRTNLLSLEP